MKRNGILNSDIARVLGYMGHTDRICIGDCGLPIPDTTERIDLTVRFGQPAFLDVLQEVGKDMKIEKIILAKEIKEKNPEILAGIEQYFAGVETGFGNESKEAEGKSKDEKTEFSGIEVEFVTHTQLKEMTRECKAVIRTGETTPYANIILQSGCIF